jgi:hypothetical protein
MANSRPSPINARKAALGIILALGIPALISLVVAVIFLHNREVRSACAGGGCQLALWGFGGGVWSAIRLRSWRHLLATLPAALAVAGWGWILYLVW